MTGYLKNETYQSMYDEVVGSSTAHSEHLRWYALSYLKVTGDKSANNGMLWCETLEDGRWMDAYQQLHHDHICNPTCAEFVENSKNTRLWELAARNSLPPDASLIEMRQMVLDKLSEEDQIILGYIL